MVPVLEINTPTRNGGYLAKYLVSNLKSCFTAGTESFCFVFSSVTHDDIRGRVVILGRKQSAVRENTMKKKSSDKHLQK